MPDDLWLGEEAWADERQTPQGQFFRVLLLARGELGGGVPASTVNTPGLHSPA